MLISMVDDLKKILSAFLIMSNGYCILPAAFVA
jgi:hypothetical protein